MQAVSRSSFAMPRATPIGGRPISTGDSRFGAVAVTDAALKLGQVERALRMMRGYLTDCAREKEEASNLRTEELNAIIHACAERLAVDRHGGVRNPRLVRDALGHAVRYIDDYLDTTLARDDMVARLGMGASASARRFKLATTTTPCQSIFRCRLRRAMMVLWHRRMRLADIAFEVGRSFQCQLTRAFRQRAGITRMRYASVRNAPPHLSAPSARAQRHRR